MNKIKLFSDGDDVKIIIFPWHKKTQGQTDEEFMESMTTLHPVHGAKFLELQLHDATTEELPERKDRDKWYPNFQNKSEKIKVDHNWEHKLMPVSVIKDKHIDKLTSFQDYRKALKMTDKEWVEQALVNLDAKVAKGEADKPTIRAKLAAKIQQLNQEES